VWWPGLSREIQDLVQQCRTCTLHRDNKPEPLIATPLPDRQWQIVATDLFQMKGMAYLIVIDYYSRYVEVAAITKTIYLFIYLLNFNYTDLNIQILDK